MSQGGRDSTFNDLLPSSVGKHGEGAGRASNGADGPRDAPRSGGQHVRQESLHPTHPRVLYRYPFPRPTASSSFRTSSGVGSALEGRRLRKFSSSFIMRGGHLLTSRTHN